MNFFPQIFPRGFEDLELLDVGLVGSGSVKTLRIGLENNNPVEIEINSVKSNSQFFSPQILGIFSKNSSEFLSQYKFANLLNSVSFFYNSDVTCCKSNAKNTRHIIWNLHTGYVVLLKIVVNLSFRQS